jgi:D-alanine-D-alanine ligase
MDDESVVRMKSPEQICELLREREAATSRAHFAEEFIEGREFNLSLIGDGPWVLPPAEIDFSAFPLGKQRIVGHGAKWDHASFEYQNTPRRFEFPASDRRLVQRLTEMSADCWRLFDLSGYARVDFRCDKDGQPWILEVNINPCIAPDAGFAAAAKQAGIGYAAIIEKIVEVAVRRGQTAVPSEPHFRPTLLV